MKMDLNVTRNVLIDFEKEYITRKDDIIRSAAKEYLNDNEVTDTELIQRVDRVTQPGFETYLIDGSPFIQFKDCDVEFINDSTGVVKASRNILFRKIKK